MILKKITEAKTYNGEIIKVKIISAEGSVPRNKGTFMLISKKNIYGSIGGGQLEYKVIEISKKNLLKKEFDKEIVNIPLGPSIGQCCGGYVQVCIEKFNDGYLALKNEKNINDLNKNLFIFGAGHVGQELSSRVLDLDILFFENVIIKNENLIIPHPRVLERRFVLEPFCDINPNFKHTILKKELKIYLSKLSKNYICKKIFD